jgi:hypothetical protein
MIDRAEVELGAQDVLGRAERRFEEQKLVGGPALHGVEQDVDIALSGR